MARDKPLANVRCRSSLPAPHRRFDQVCALGYQGRKRGEVVRTHMVVLQAHTHQFLGTFGGSGNGDYRGELRRAIQVITTYATQLGLPTASIFVRLDGLYGDAVSLLDVLSADLGVIARSRAYHLLDLAMVKQTLVRAPVHVSTHPESGMTHNTSKPLYKDFISEERWLLTQNWPFGYTHSID